MQIQFNDFVVKNTVSDFKNDKKKYICSSILYIALVNP